MSFLGLNWGEVAQLRISSIENFEIFEIFTFLCLCNHFLPEGWPGCVAHSPPVSKTHMEIGDKTVSKPFSKAKLPAAEPSYTSRTDAFGNISGKLPKAHITAAPHFKMLKSKVPQHLGSGEALESFSLNSCSAATLAEIVQPSPTFQKRQCTVKARDPNHT